MVHTYVLTSDTKMAVACVFIMSILPSALCVSVAQFSSIEMPSSAVATFVTSGLGPHPSNASVLVTTFSPTSEHDSIYILSALSSVKSNPDNYTYINLLIQFGVIINFSEHISIDRLSVVDGDTQWPNQADYVAAGVVPDSPAAVLGASGFFVSVPLYPSKSTGSVDLNFQNEDGTTFSKVRIDWLVQFLFLIF